MLIDVLSRVAADTGYEPVDQRDALVALLNQSAAELANMLECNRMYREVTLVIQPNKVVSLPSYIGQLKGMRMHTNDIPFQLAGMNSPRYVNNTYEYKWKNWRDLGDSPIQTTISTPGPLTITGNGTGGDVLLIAGQGQVASRVEESVTTVNGSVQTTNLFGPKMFKIACLKPRDCDYTIYDADGNEIAVLANTDNQTRYKIVDVSQLFWSLDTSDGGSLIDVCYKVPTTRLTKDTDSFFAGDDYDNAWYFLSMHLYLNPLQGREQEAILAKQNCIMAIDSAKDSSENTIVKKLSFGRNKFMGLFRKYRYYRGSVTNVDSNTGTTF